MTHFAVKPSFPGTASPPLLAHIRRQQKISEVNASLSMMTDAESQQTIVICQVTLLRCATAQSGRIHSYWRPLSQVTAAWVDPNYLIAAGSVPHRQSGAVRSCSTERKLT
jgi:hypothetical protein